MYIYLPAFNLFLLPNAKKTFRQTSMSVGGPGQITKLLPLIESSCSDRARFLFCSSLFPLCTPDVPRPVTACKSLCETVKSDCSTRPELMQLWPDFLNCDTLPQPEKHELCMQVPQEAVVQQQQPQIEPRSNSVQQQQQQQQQQEQSELQLIEQQQQHQPFHWPWMAWKLQAQLDKNIAPPAVICPENFTANPFRLDECVPQCNRDAFHTTHQKKTIEDLLLGLSAICFVLTLFSLVTFWAEPTRFGYPERPVLFLCLCYNLFSVCYLERIVFHNSARGPPSLGDPTRKVIFPCTLTSPCLASYITTSYLSLCAATWWLIFALCFYLSSHKKWSSEALEKRSGLFHVMAWVPPLAPPIAALLLERVEPDELTGMCSASVFVEIPALILLLLGLYFTLRASRSLHTLHHQMQLTLGHQRFSQIRKRFLIFSLVFFLPSLGGVLASFFERNGNYVPACVSHEDCTAPQQQTAWPTLIRIFFRLVGGTMTGIWVWSRKTCESYRSRLVATPTSSSTSKSMISSLPKKHFSTTTTTTTTSSKQLHCPLYNGINFHNIPVYNPNQSRV